MNTVFKLIAVSASCLAALSLPACSRDDSKTAGQGVDKTIDNVKAQAESAKTATKDAANRVSSSATDATITTKVNATLVADAGLKVMKVDVDTKDGRVSLMGTAPDEAARERATTMVKLIDGVTSVDNQLRVAAKP